MRSKPRPAKFGFTLIELLVAIAIISILIAILLPAAQAAREAARRAQCLNNLRQFGLAMHNYHDSIGTFPMAYVAANNPDPSVVTPGWGWSSMILPYMEQATLYNGINFNLAVEHSANSTSRTTALSSFTCPSDWGVGRFTVIGSSGNAIVDAQTISYAADYGFGNDISTLPSAGTGPFVRNTCYADRDIVDGLSFTMFIAERTAALTQIPSLGAINGGVCVNRLLNRGPKPAPVMPLAGGDANSRPGNLFVDVDDFLGSHPNGLNALMGDGSVKFLKKSIVKAVYGGLLTRAGGEVISADDF
jgi:prepilin-type N-terminal cleavage/methylation domain-containing protein/prepilin-type processing-associated H-X9-DG protein